MPDAHHDHREATTVMSSCVSSVLLSHALSSYSQLPMQCVACSAEGREWQGAFTFVQMADCQLGMHRNNKSWDEERATLRRGPCVSSSRRQYAVGEAGVPASTYPSGCPPVRTHRPVLSRFGPREQHAPATPLRHDVR